MQANSQRMIFRWLALFAIFLSVIFSNTYTYFSGSASIADVADKYPVYILPASFAFFIWAVIYISLMIFGVAMVMPFQKDFVAYDKLSVPVIFICILNTAWIVFFTHNYIGVSLLMLVLSTATAFRAFRIAYLAVQYRDYNLWFQFPFSLISGWLTVASFINLFVYLQYLGWSGNMAEGSLATLAIWVLAAISFLISIRTYSLVFPAVVGWGLIAISIERQNDAPAVGTMALTAALLLLVCSFFSSVFRKIKSRTKVKQSLDI